MNETVTEQATPATAPAPVEPAAAVKRNSPDAVVFATIWNRSTSRQDALKRFADAGYTMSYGALVARVKSYTDADRADGPINLKSLPAAPRGRRIVAADVNKAIAEAAAADAVADSAS